LGVGSALRGDDVAGILVAQDLDKFIQRSPKVRLAKVFIGDTAPENVTGEIKKFKPTDIIIVDSADMGKPAGSLELIESGRISGVTFSTHQLPLGILADYLKASLNCQILIIGIQPKKLKFNSKVSPEVKRAAKRFTGIIKDIIGRRIT